MPITSDTDQLVDQTSSGTVSRSAGLATTGFTRKAGGPGVRDSTTSLVASLIAMLKHPFGVHDYIEELDYEMKDGVLVELGIERYCWLCGPDRFST